MKTAITADAAVQLLLDHYFFSELYYSMKVIEDDPRVDTLATDGFNLWVHPPFYNTLTLEFKKSAVCHELIHKMLMHPTRMRGMFLPVGQIAADIVTNMLLVENGFKIAPTWVQPVPKYKDWSFEAVYNDLMNTLPPPPKPKPGQPGGEGKGTPVDMDDPSIPQQWKDAWKDVKPQEGTPAEIEKIEQKIQQQVERALVNAKAQGQMPKGVEMKIRHTYQVAKEPWFNHLARYLQALTTAEYNWRRMNRRHLVVHHIFAPANQSESLGVLGIFVDASGSVYTKAQQARFGEHINAILSETRPKQVYVYYFDTIVHKHVEVEPGSIDFDEQPQGGGGTSFDKLWGYAEDEGHVLDLAIVLTDLEGTMPREQPPYPVVWASIEKHAVPFGEAVYID